MSNKNEVNDENSIKNTNFDKIINVNHILTRRLIQNFDHFCNIRMSFFNITNEFNNFKIFATKLKLFLENDAINFFNVRKNFIKSLNMLHDITSNLKKNKFVIVLDFELFYFNIVNKKERVMKNMIDDDFINDTNKLNHWISRFHENRRHSH